jgi:uncharacterized protein YkwD
MASKLFLLVVLASLTGSATAAQGAAAVGLHEHRVVNGAAKRARTAPRTPLLTSLATCPGGNNLKAPIESQERAMRCMTNVARNRAGLPGLTDASELDLSASSKSDDILRCNSFSHFACGRPFTYWMQETGYISVPCWHVGENLAWGDGEYGTARSIFHALMRSPEHRANILGNYSQLGLSLRVGALDGRAGTRVWTQHFGTQCDLAGAEEGVEAGSEEGVEASTEEGVEAGSEEGVEAGSEEGVEASAPPSAGTAPQPAVATGA